MLTEADRQWKARTHGSRNQYPSKYRQTIVKSPIPRRPTRCSTLFRSASLPADAVSRACGRIPDSD
jgi:hypothetical protein